MGPLVPTGMTQGRLFSEAEMRVRLGMAEAPAEAAPDDAGPVRWWRRWTVAWGWWRRAVA